MIRSAVKSMSQLLDEVSFIGKADTGKLQCELVLLDLQAFCRQLIRETELSTAQKQITIIFTASGQLGEALWDEHLLRHILGNLLTNAIKYSFVGSKVDFELIAQEKSVTFRIKDRGIGIPKNELQQLFQPFHRASNVGAIPGTGLGLAIVKKCVEAYKGEISVESEVGVGTTFTVTLPVVKR